MEQYSASRSAAEKPGFFASLSGIGKNVFSLLINRFELAALEATALGTNLAKIAAFCAVAAIGALFAIAYWSFLIVALAWEAMGAWILLIMALLFTAVVIGFLMAARNIVKSGKLSLPATMAELRHDRDMLFEQEQQNQRGQHNQYDQHDQHNRHDHAHRETSS
jgi:uncharacterized membrane protein YqjE